MGTGDRVVIQGQGHNLDGATGTLADPPAAEASEEGAARLGEAVDQAYVLLDEPDTYRQHLSEFTGDHAWAEWGHVVAG